MKKASPSAAAQVEELRQRCEVYLETVFREEYQFASGLKPETDLAEIEASYSNIPTLKNIRLVNKVLEKASRDEAVRLYHLLLFLIEEVMEEQTGPLRNRYYAMQDRIKLKIQGKVIPFRRSQTVLASEPDRVVRLLVGSEQHRVFGKLNPLRLKMLKMVHQTSKRLNKEGHLELCCRRIGVDLRAMGKAADQFLSETRDLYLEKMEKAARERLGLALDDLRREDLAFLLGESEFDEAFPANAMISSTEKLLRGMGVKPTARGRIAYDFEDRKDKSPRACCYLIRVPEELVVSVQPKPGPVALRQFLQEVGQAVHRASIQSSLPFEHRCLGSPSVFLATGNLFGRLLLNRPWISRQPGVRNPEPFLALNALKEMYVLRLLATQLKYELVLHQEKSPEKLDAVFSDLVAEHCSVRFAPESYLFFTDLHFFSARYLRGLLLESVLRQRLENRFGAEWFDVPEAGRFLRDFWKQGGKLSFAGAMERFGGKELDLSPLVRDVQRWME